MTIKLELFKNTVLELEDEILQQTVNTWTQLFKASLAQQAR